MSLPATMTEQVENMVDLDISYRTMHDTMLINNDVKNKSIQVPFASLTHKYRDYLESITEEITLSPEARQKYRFKPKLLSDDLYGSTEFWSDLLVLNNCYSVAMFKPTIVKIYDPNQFKEMLNEILILEEEYNMS